MLPFVKNVLTVVFCIPTFLVSVAGIPCQSFAAAEKPRYQEGPRLNNPDPMVQAGFGLSIAVERKRVLVGAPHEVSREGETGKAYLFDAETGNLLHTYLPPSPIVDSLFGLSVGFADNLVVIGSPQGRGQKGFRNGAVYLFDSDTGALVRTLFSPSPSAEIFGHAVAVQGKWLLVGDPGASVDTHFHVGAAYLFDARSGRLVHEFLFSDSPQGEADRFGYAVGFVGFSVVVAAPLGGESPMDGGVVYLFDRESGLMRHRLTSPQPQTQEYFGWGIAGDEHGLLIGAPGNRKGNMDRGAAYLFDEQGKFQHTLISPSPTNRARFGEAVGMMSHYAIVGAPGGFASGIEAGGIFLFDRSKGRFEFLIENTISGAGVEDAFGLSISGSKEAVVVGSPFGGRGRRIDAGVVHQFRLLPPLTIGEGEWDRFFEGLEKVAL